jgi:ribosomal protein S11
MGDKLKLWFYPEVDYLEVTFSDGHGHMRPTNTDAVMKRVDEEGRVIGFSVFGVSRFQKDRPLEFELAAEGRIADG